MSIDHSRIANPLYGSPKSQAKGSESYRTMEGHVSEGVGGGVEREKFLQILRKVKNRG